MTGHTAPFPDALAKDHVISWSNLGDIVFDPFLGTGTTGAAAISLGRSFVGIERESAYYEMATNRVLDAATAVDHRPWRSILPEKFRSPSLRIGRLSPC